MNTILILNGPNLNLLVQREPRLYGSEILADVQAECEQSAANLGLSTDFRKTNAEHQQSDLIHEARTTTPGPVINSGMLSHTSVSLMEALSAYPHR